jgi:Protein of unknown function (DUF3667)
MQQSPVTHIKALQCRNCGSPALGKFCPQCGQDTAPHPPSAGEFIHEFIGHYIAFEGKLWKTLALLFFKPGQLTKEYLAGRKLRYVLPLRLYLTISLIFFVALGFGVNVATQVVSNEKELKESMSDSSISIGAFNGPGGFVGARLDKDGTFICNLPAWACSRMRSKIERMKTAPASEVANLLGKFRDDWPYAMFLLMPVFALLMKVAYWRRGMVYGEHLVFAFHVHAAWFVLALITLLLPDSVNGLPLIAMPVYTMFVMHRVYGGRWWSTLLRGLAISLPYLVSILMVMILLGLCLFIA